MQDFRSLRVWHLAKELTPALERALPARACRRLPGFRSQILRAAGSVSGNIAEGCSKRSRDEFRRYLETSLGSLLEVESNLELAISCAILRADVHNTLATKAAVLRRMLISFMDAVERNDDRRGDPR
ncbi:MAG TPA: four helix bundle protein [Gemmatimonadaceae bacterium]|nr:four helix bundle protein [Gemmatimonadaceae bacterium]